MNLHTSQMQRDREPTKENIEHVHQYDERRTKIKGEEREREKKIATKLTTNRTV